ncbi:hypothetical protein DYB26_004143 [Aphanomyces astaci]|uniref:HTH myb-type domain-containing protein n=1 Tax=Aphanomyces astaci TaxID=112090 RepID=A0A3R7EEV0_APHAT|nr:hypothetical protein DYB26_004143 [Aphanomyces astaci]
MGGLMQDVNTRWSDDERSKFMSGLQQYGSDWNRIARVVDSKTVQEVYEYASLHYKTMMTGKDLRSLESMQTSGSIISDQMKSSTDSLPGGGTALVSSFLPAGSVGPVVSPTNSTSDDIVKCKQASTQDENCATHEPNTTNKVTKSVDATTLLARSYVTGAVVVPASPPPTNRSRFEDKIKDLSDADIKMLLRKRLLDMQERRQESMLKRKQNESYVNHQLSAFHTRHGASPESVASKPSKGPLSKKRKQSTTPKPSSSSTDFFAGVNALAMVSCEALQRYNLKYIRRGSGSQPHVVLHDDDGAAGADNNDEDDVPRHHRFLQTPASQQCSVPWDFSIAPKLDADKMDSAKRAKWSDDEHRLFLAGIEKHGRKWKKVQEHVPTKSRDQIRTHAYAHFAKVQSNKVEHGDVLEVAGFLSSLAQVPRTPTAAKHNEVLPADQGPRGASLLEDEIQPPPAAAPGAANMLGV